MANLENAVPALKNDDEQLRLEYFKITGLLGGEPIEINFPKAPANGSEASILILQGRNGSGKTTILRMIDEMLELDFDPFRQIPFSYAQLGLSNGDSLEVRWSGSADFPLTVSFGPHSAALARDKAAAQYTKEHSRLIDLFREAALPVLGSINFEFLGVERSAHAQPLENVEPALRRHIEAQQRRKTLASKVAEFIREAQLNHRKFFRQEELSILPNLLKRLRVETASPSRDELLERVHAVQNRSAVTRRFGLHTEDEELKMLAEVLALESELSQSQLSLVETYVEMQEAGQRSKDLVAHRLQEFESIMDEFFLGKQILVDSKNGLTINSASGRISEAALSSGEYHFLYMMVSALLCRRIGSIIAIDEPELSLHVKWQRKLLSALSRCAAGASPLFICATHSLAISAEHSDRVQVLSAVD